MIPIGSASHSSVTPSVVLKTILTLAMITVLGLMILSFGVGVYAFFGTEMSSNADNVVVGQIPFFFIGQPIVVNASITVSNLFTILWILYAVLFAVSMFGPGASALKVLENTKYKGLGVIFENGITTVAATFPILASSILLIDSIQEKVGISSGSLPEQDPAIAFTYITLAPVVEEIGFRASIIGLIIALWLVIRGGRLQVIKVILFPNQFIYPTRRDHPALTLVIITIVASAILFGYAHIAAGAGWMLGKITTATLAGLVLGWVYVRSGLPAAIILHWSFNYFTSSYYYFDRAFNTFLLSSLVDGVVLFTGVLTAMALLGWLFKTVAAKGKLEPVV